MTVTDAWAMFDIEFDEVLVAWRRLRPEVGPDPGLDVVLGKNILATANRAIARLEQVES